MPKYIFFCEKEKDSKSATLFFLKPLSGKYCDLKYHKKDPDYDIRDFVCEFHSFLPSPPLSNLVIKSESIFLGIFWRMRWKLPRTPFPLRLIHKLGQKEIQFNFKKLRKNVEQFKNFLYTCGLNFIVQFNLYIQSTKQLQNKQKWLISLENFSHWTYVCNHNT